MATATSYVGGDKTTRWHSKGASGVERVLETAGETAGKVAGAVEYSTDAVSDAADSAVKTANDVTGAVRKSLKEHPTITLVVAVAIGFVLGALWKD